MYIPKSFENQNIVELQQFIEKYNFATLISYNAEGISVSHIPVMIDRTKGHFGTLIWHLAKLNKHSKILHEKINTLCIFHGPHSYISPNWYKTSPNVPTWNYAVVHAYGVASVINKDELSEDLDNLVSHHELLSNSNYNVPENHKTKLLEHIEGFHMEIAHIEGKFKLGQNRSLEDQNAMLNELSKQKTNSDALALADFIKNIMAMAE